MHNHLSFRSKACRALRFQSRCTGCGHIFWVVPPPFSDNQPRLESVPELGPSRALEDDKETAALPMKPAKKTFWVLGTILLFVLLAPAGRFLVIQHLHPNWTFSDAWSSVFFLPIDPEGNQKISLMNIKKNFKENSKIGRFFVIEGEIKNGYPSAPEYQNPGIFENSGKSGGRQPGSLFRLDLDQRGIGNPLTGGNKQPDFIST